MHLDLWMAHNHDPPKTEKIHLPVHMGQPKSQEWWETINDISHQGNNEEGIYQMPYEDEYSQLTPY